MRASREYARYERRVVQTPPERVIGEVARQYKVAREEIFRGIRGRENEARKVAMYVVKRFCNRTLAEMAEYFGVGNYSAVGWSCRAIESKMAREKRLRDRIEKIIASMHQLQTPRRAPGESMAGSTADELANEGIGDRASA